MRIIPAIDIIGGKCVRLSKGDFNTQKTYHDHPLEVAKMFEAAGLTHLHLVDLDGAKSGRVINYNVLESICTHTNLTVDFGGGIKSDQDLRIAFDCGATQITGGSIAVKNQGLFKDWIEQYGSEKIILGADCHGRKIATGGWLESSDLDVLAFIRNYEEAGIEYVICTDIAKDGMLAGPSITLYQEILNHVKIKLVASGGVSSMDDLMVLNAVGCEGAIVGKAIYEGKIKLKELGELF